MTSNDLLLAHLAAGSDDETVLRAMSAAVFGLTGEVGPQGFGATTLEGRLVLFTHPEFYAVAGLPPGLEAVEAAARRAAEYAKAVGLSGFVLNPGTHQRFVDAEAVDRLHAPLRPPEPLVVPTLVPWADPASALVDAIRDAAEGTGIEKAWLAQGAVVVTLPHPDPAFEAGLLARDVRMRSYGAEPTWVPIFEREATGKVQVRFGALTASLSPSLVADLAAEARRQGLAEMWAFEARVEGERPVLAFAYTPFPNDRFAAGFDVLHTRHGLGDDSPLLDADTLREALPRMGMRLL